jgi:hypothetical protein
MLGEENIRLGVEFWDRCKAGKVTRDGDAHHVVLERDGHSASVAARWIVDATGRAGVLKRQLGLSRDVGHKCNAVWFRIAKTIDLDGWSDAPHWHNRVPKGLRWLSTNHFMGHGYWVWFIPLAPGATSIGIVADASLHPMSEMNSFERALVWMRRYEPHCAGVVEEHRGLLMDFRAIKHYAYGCARVFSGDRWALTGEAGVFTDPFYSPGSDFIGIGNTFITDLILRDLDGESIAARASEYNRIYLNTYESFITIYENQYPLMGNPRVMAPKIVWDFAIYWGFLALQFVDRRLCDLDLMAQAGQILQRVNHLNVRMQAFFRDWDALDQREWDARFIDVTFQRGDGPDEEIDRREWDARFIDLLYVDIMRRFHYELQDHLPGGALLARLSQNLRLVESLAAAIFHEAARILPDAPNRPINPYAITMNSHSWEEEGLFDSSQVVEVEEVAAATMKQIRLTPVTGARATKELEYAG